MMNSTSCRLSYTTFLLRCTVALIMMLSASTQAETKVFDHMTTGFELLSAHRVLACESCHVDGQFAGTPRECRGCHVANGRFDATIKPINHMLASNQCENCHQPITWAGAVLVDHTQVFGPCQQCHNHLIAEGQKPNHIPTGGRECVDCHSEVSWLPARFDHDGIDQNCFSCHNGVYAMGRSVSHINASLVCEACHTSTSAWAPVPVVNHDQVIGSCYSCHAQDRQATTDHINASNECDACHGTFFFSPTFTVDHNQVIGTCSSCHNGVIAPGQKVGHIPTGALECDFCHSTMTFERGPL